MSVSELGDPKGHPDFEVILREFAGHALAGSLAYSTGNSDPDRVAERAIQFGELTACILIQKYGSKDGRWVRFASVPTTTDTPPSTTRSSKTHSAKPHVVSKKS
jgi:hypothetical protein|tara:strand:- start:288 stop:599 length:312 start_codon:yes stop_codon:yes gene_type:complete